MTADREKTSDRPNGTQLERVARYFQTNPNARDESNRHIARAVRVDETTVRLYKRANGVPPLTKGGKPAETKPARRKKKK